MKTKVKESGLQNLELMRKKIQYLIGAKVHNHKRISEASHDIDKLRRKVDGWNSVEIIRKFRGKI